MQQQNVPSVPLARQQIRPAGFIATLENWHETYTRLNPWAHGGFFERVIHKLSRNAEEARTASAQSRNSDLATARLTLVPRDKTTSMRARADAY